jgi:hypothetical protein
VRSRGRALVLVLAAVGGAGSCGRWGDSAAPPDAAERAVLEVRNAYTSHDAVPASAFTWTAPDGTVFVLVDVESGIEGVAQARADLWVVGAGGPARLARSDVMPSAATIGAFAFADLTGDGLPDLLGYVQDSAGAAFPIFLPGARGMLVDELDDVAGGFRLSAQPEDAPTVVSGPHGPCALELWTEAPAPDSQPAGWRFLALLPGGRLGAPTSVAPTCR